ncbi:MAG: biopolymer transporter ExbD [Bacteroidia bacterium]|nr:biopolymer transporter ExbD [Bacteroidia bacterium]
MALRSRNKPSPEFNSASISDIVFLLLIYFMLASTFVTQSSIRIQLPSSTSDRPASGGHNITVGQGGQIAFDNQIVQEKEDLRPFLEGFLNDENKQNDIVNLRIDKEVTFQEAAGVMGIISEYENAKLVILTEREN